MELRKFYLEKVVETEYYYQFYELINEINYVENVFVGKVKEYDYEFNIFDVEDAIEKFKSLCQPENEEHNNEDRCWFYLILFYLYKNNYIIEEFPRLIERPPKNTYQFVNQEIRNKLLANGRDRNGVVPYAERRKLVASINFKQKEDHIVLDEFLERKFIEISTRQASFNEMRTDEKISEIANLIENFLKKGDRFISLDYSIMCFEYIDDAKIKEYRKQIQSFRHSSEVSLKERASYSEKQKMFFVEYGVLILKIIHSLLADKE